MPHRTDGQLHVEVISKVDLAVQKTMQAAAYPVNTLSFDVLTQEAADLLIEHIDEQVIEAVMEKARLEYALTTQSV